MNNSHAEAIRQAAARWLARGEEHFRNDQEMLDAYETDHYQLMSIAQMIDDNAEIRVIRQAILNLDTILRDEIPEETYYAFTEVYIR
jgi:hypothetical protein